MSLLFSDIEGSTALLKRLGPAYSDALDGQRQVLRKAWADHAGTELGTEGDSFYVVFPTAEAAVAAATQGQRDLAGFEWPGGERVRVRMGIHTGSPKVHDGAYVGMDVHRAARIAGAAHGGQVVVSSATVELVTECLPEQVTVKDLGSHKLKDITNPERLFQLAIEGLLSEFPPPKTLGTTSSLPRSATPLVGRDGELAELTALLSPDVRLVTLTGPGGSGKTRLAIAVAERLVDRFPDGVYFVPLEAVTTADVMWTTIAEVLDVPPEGRVPPGFLDHVAHRTALFVLDNLEQIPNADTVVTELLEHAPQVMVIATSRRPLALEAEHLHPVPPLELPYDATLEDAQASGAVQMFVARARKVKPGFTLTENNAAAVVELCRRLDGLPLALELAAARTRLLSPKALLARLETALDIAAFRSLTPARQKTLRATIAWSYNLLDPQQQGFFRRLGVFAGGADLDAIGAVTADIVEGVDLVDLLAATVDASLVTVSEDDSGEPRIHMMETIRMFAVDELLEAGEWTNAVLTHVDYYTGFAGSLAKHLFERNHSQAVRGFEIEMGNFREALFRIFTEQKQKSLISSDVTTLGVTLCSAAGLYWIVSSHAAEGERWLRKAIAAGSGDAAELARVKTWLSWMLSDPEGDPAEAIRLAEEALVELEVSGDLKDQCRAAGALAWGYFGAGRLEVAHQLGEKVLRLAQESGDGYMLTAANTNQALVDWELGDVQAALRRLSQARDLAVRRGDEFTSVQNGLTLAEWHLESGTIDGAIVELAASKQLLFRLEHPGLILYFVLLYARVLRARNAAAEATRLLAAAQRYVQGRTWSFGHHERRQWEDTANWARRNLSSEQYSRAHDAGIRSSISQILADGNLFNDGSGGPPTLENTSADTR